MYFTTQTIAVVASLLSGAMAQTYSACNPLTNGTECGQDLPAFGTKYEWDFTKGKCPEFTATGSANRITYDSEGMHMAVAARKDSPTLTCNKYIMWGKVSVVMKAAPGQGVISSYVFQSDVLDEIDYEWIGSKGGEVQSNYFGKGDTSSYDRGGIHPCGGAMDQFHEYAVEWKKEGINWYIDGKLTRTVTPDQVKGKWTRYPQTPMQIKIGSWDAGYAGNSNGTIEWAGGLTQYAKGPFAMVVKSISIEDYSAGAKYYSYGDNSGSWESIKISTKEIEKNTTSTETDEPTGTATASTLATASGTGSYSAPTGTNNSTATGGGYSAPTAASSTMPVPTPSPNAASGLKAVGSAFALVAAAAALIL